MEGLAHDTEPASHIQGAAAAGAHLEIGEPPKIAAERGVSRQAVHKKYAAGRRLGRKRSR